MDYTASDYERYIGNDFGKAVAKYYLKAYGDVVGKAAGKRPLRRPRPRWEDNIKTNLREIGWGRMDWINLVKDREQCRTLVITVINVRGS
jgi:hypothetical protein